VPWLVSAHGAPFRMASFLVALLLVWAPGCDAGAPADDKSQVERAFAMPTRLNPEPRFPRVVLVTIDTLRADHLRSYGYPRDTAPFLDTLAAGGVRFERAMSPIPHTAPSHASMFTGRVPSLHGVRVNGQNLPKGAPTLAGLFRSAGFLTAAITSVGFLRGVTPGFSWVSAEARPAHEVTSAAIHWLEMIRSGDAFFLWVHYYDVHEWYRRMASDDRRASLLNWTDLGGEAWIEALADSHGWARGDDGSVLSPLRWGLTRLGGQDEPRPLRVRSIADALAWIDTYDVAIGVVDAQIRRLFEFLDRMQPRMPTLWVVTSDHGEGLGGHGTFGHGQHLYQEQLHVPLFLFASDGSLAAGTVEARVSLVDLAPTVAHLVGASAGHPDSKLEGVSLVPLLDGSGDAPDRPIFAERAPPDAKRRAMGWRYDDLHALQHGAHKYIRVEGGGDEFYDVAADPRELHNRIDEPSVERDALRRLLDSHLEKLPIDSDAVHEPEEQFVEELRALGYVE
jgi:arylsulfatase A-like enzyme